MTSYPVVESFEIDGVLGEGAMGVVYRAQQTHPVRRPVALKVLRAGVATPQVLARFETERQSLAVMDHPGIARIFDAGLTKDGRPYFAMELVDGAPLTRFCDEGRLPIRDRLKLFAAVCRAVQHAHQKGIIHRDLKPSNILISQVDGDPWLGVIDFGIAKATSTDQIADAALTQDDQVIGSPAYMSPEQVDRSSDVDTRTDIYCLGIVLYELMVGALPFDTSRYQGWAAIAAQLSAEPPAPSRRLESLASTQLTIAHARSTTPAHLRRELSGDLDWIVTRATEKERERRYETAVGFALDVERYLANEPIRARGATTLYRARKFVRRHRVGVAFSTTVAIGLVAFSIVTSVQADRIARARDLARARQGQAEGLIGFTIGDLAPQLGEVGRLDIMDGVASAALAYFDAVDPSELSDEELFRRAQTVQQLGEIRADQGEWETARGAFYAALRDYRTLEDRDATNDEWQLGLGEGLFYVGFAHRSIGAGDSALVYWESYQDVAIRNAARRPDDLVWQRELAATATNVALQRRSLGDREGALGPLRDVMEAKRRIAQATPDDAEAQYDVTRGLYNLGVALSDLGMLHEARAVMAEAAAAKEAQTEDPRAPAEWRINLLSNLGRLTELAGALGDSASARVSAARMLELGRTQETLDPTNSAWATEIAVARSYLARWDPTATVELDRSVTSLTELHDASPGHNSIPLSLASALVLRAARRLEGGRLGGAETDARSALGILDEYLLRREGHRSASFRRAEALLVVGDLNRARGDAAAGVPAWDDALQTVVAWDDSRTWSEVSVLAALAERLDRTELAAEMQDRLQAFQTLRP